jgi:hypothetical protein
VQAFVSRKPGRYFSVTGKTLQRRLTAKLMATGAVGGSIQRLMWPRKWSRGDLRWSRAAQPYREKYQSEKRGDAERKTDRPDPAPAICHCVVWHYSLRFACKHGSDFALWIEIVANDPSAAWLEEWFVVSTSAATFVFEQFDAVNSSCDVSAGRRRPFGPASLFALEQRWNQIRGQLPVGSMSLVLRRMFEFPKKNTESH